MTLSDVQSILEDDNLVLRNKTAREQTEARNHRAALHYILDELLVTGNNFSWTEDLIKNIHLRLMNTLISDAGQFRRHGVRIMGSRVPLANSLSIPEKLAKLTHRLDQPTTDVLTNLAETHAYFEQVHPFSDGNGCIGRLILLAQALKYKIVPPIVQKERKRAYYSYLATAQLDQELAPLKLFLAESIQTAQTLLNS